MLITYVMGFETKTEINPFSFYKADIIDLAGFTVGLANTHHVIKTTEDDAWEVVRQYIKDNDHLKLPDPMDAFDFSRSFRRATADETMLFRKIHHSWIRVYENIVSIDFIKEAMTAEIPPVPPITTPWRTPQLTLEFNT